MDFQEFTKAVQKIEQHINETVSDDFGEVRYIDYEVIDGVVNVAGMNNSGDYHEFNLTPEQFREIMEGGENEA